jgi:hypothetical protein
LDDSGGVVFLAPESITSSGTYQLVPIRVAADDSVRTGAPLPGGPFQDRLGVYANPAPASFVDYYAGPYSSQSSGTFYRLDLGSLEVRVLGPIMSFYILAIGTNANHMIVGQPRSPTVLAIADLDLESGQTRDLLLASCPNDDDCAALGAWEPALQAGGSPTTAALVLVDGTPRSSAYDDPIELLLIDGNSSSITPIALEQNLNGQSIAICDWSLNPGGQCQGSVLDDGGALLARHALLDGHDFTVVTHAARSLVSTRAFPMERPDPSDIESPPFEPVIESLSDRHELWIHKLSDGTWTYWVGRTDAEPAAFLQRTFLQVRSELGFSADERWIYTFERDPLSGFVQLFRTEAEVSSP